MNNSEEGFKGNPVREGRRGEFSSFCFIKETRREFRIQALDILKNPAGGPEFLRQALDMFLDPAGRPPLVLASASDFGRRAGNAETSTGHFPKSAAATAAGAADPSGAGGGGGNQCPKKHCMSENILCPKETCFIQTKNCFRT